MNNLLAQNLKRLRTEKKYTQEEAAQFLNVSAQTISRWECNATTPDVMLLPEIARLYCVTVDDLFNEHSNAYDNYAQRLGSIYEDTRDPEDFMRARAEFERLYCNGNCSPEDFRMYGIIHQYMMNYCKGKAFEAFDRILDKAETKDETFWMTLRQKLYLLAQIGRSKEGVEFQKKRAEESPSEAQEWICLIAAYSNDGDNESALKCFAETKRRFPNEALVYIYGGNLYKDLGNTEEAFKNWDHALELDADCFDAMWAKGFCFEETGKWHEAYNVWTALANKYKNRGFIIEMKEPLERAKECAKNM